MKTWLPILAVVMLCGCAPRLDKVELGIAALEEHALDAESAIGVMRPWMSQADARIERLGGVVHETTERSVCNARKLREQELHLVVAETKIEVLEQEVAEEKKRAEYFAMTVDERLGHLGEHVALLEIQLGRIIVVEAQIQALTSRIEALEQAPPPPGCDCGGEPALLGEQLEAISATLVTIGEGLLQKQSGRCGWTRQK